MRTATILCATLLLVTLLGSAPTDALAARNIDVPVDVSTPPPEPIYEVEVGERPGYILTPGYWHWDGKRYLWHTGRWLKTREGYNWVPDGWVQRGDKWRFAPGYWEVAEGYEEVVEKLAEEKSVASTTKKKSKKYRRKINYNDPNKWPRYRRR